MIIIPDENESETEYFLRMSRLLEAQKQRYADLEKIEKLSEFMDSLDAYESVLGPVDNERRQKYLENKLNFEEKYKKDWEESVDAISQSIKEMHMKRGSSKEEAEKYAQEFKENSKAEYTPPEPPKFFAL